MISFLAAGALWVDSFSFSLSFSSSFWRDGLKQDFSLTKGVLKGALGSADGFKGWGVFCTMTWSAVDLSTSRFSGSAGLTLLCNAWVHPWKQSIKKSNCNNYRNKTIYNNNKKQKKKDLQGYLEIQWNLYTFFYNKTILCKRRERPECQDDGRMILQEKIRIIDTYLRLTTLD